MVKNSDNRAYAEWDDRQRRAHQKYEQEFFRDDFDMFGLPMPKPSTVKLWDRTPQDKLSPRQRRKLMREERAVRQEADRIERAMIEQLELEERQEREQLGYGAW